MFLIDRWCWQKLIVVYSAWEMIQYQRSTFAASKSKEGIHQKTFQVAIRSWRISREEFLIADETQRWAFWESCLRYGRRATCCSGDPGFLWRGPCETWARFGTALSIVLPLEMEYMSTEHKTDGAKEDEDGSDDNKDDDSGRDVRSSDCRVEAIVSVNR